MAFQYLMTWLFCYLYACLISFTIGTSSTLIAVTKDLIAILKSIDESIHDENTQLKIAENLNVFIQFHSTLKQLKRILFFLLVSNFSMWKFKFDIFLLGWQLMIRI